MPFTQPLIAGLISSFARLSSLCRLILLIMLLALAGAPLRAQVQPDADKFTFGEVDLELLEQVGQLDKKFEETGLVYQDTATNAYLERIGLSLLPKDGQPERVTWKFRVFRDPSLNAFAMPNGSIYVHTGLLALLENESQLAGVLAHEITHVLNRHAYLSYRSYRKKMVAMHVIAAVSSYTGPGVAVAGLAAQFILSLTIIGYSREMEKEADLEGTRILLASDYDQQEMAGAFRQLQKKYEVELWKEFFYSDHPKLQDRISYVSELVDKSPQRKTLTAAQTAELKGRYLTNVVEATRHNIRLDIEKGLYRTARAQAQKLVDFQADSADNIVYLADAYAALGPRTVEPTPQELTGKGKGEARKTRTRMTLAEEEKTLASTPAGQQQQKASYAQAEKLYRRAVELDSQIAVAYRGLGALLEKQQQSQPALEAYRRYIELQPTAFDRLLIVRRIRTLEDKLASGSQTAVPK